MKKFIILTLILLSNLFAFNYDLKPKKINENTWCFLGKLEAPTKDNGGFMSNSCYVKTKNSYVLIDTGATYQFAEQAYEAMSKIEKLPVKAVITTHHHDDHWLGNSFYKEKFNATIYGPNTVNTNYHEHSKTRMFNNLAKETIENTKIIKIDKVISKASDIKIDNLIFSIIPIGSKAHSSDDLFVYIEKSKTLFSGDLIMNGRITSNREGSVIGQLKAIDMINSKDWDYLIPGHGFIVGKNAAKEAQQYFTLLKQRVMEAVEEDVGVDEVNNVVKLEEFKSKKLYDMLNKRNVFEAYSELEFYEEE